jgi:hypothetical protein
VSMNSHLVDPEVRVVCEYELVVSFPPKQTCKAKNIL